MSTSILNTKKKKMAKEVLKEYTQVLLAADNQCVGLAQTQGKTLVVMMSVSTTLCLRRNRAKNCFSNYLRRDRRRDKSHFVLSLKMLLQTHVQSF